MLTVLLLVSNLGLAINVHYCADEIASITINVAPDSGKLVDECCGIVEEEPGCCNDKILKAEIKSDQIIVESLSFDPALNSVVYEWKPMVFISKNYFKQKDKFKIESKGIVIVPKQGFTELNNFISPELLKLEN